METKQKDIFRRLKAYSHGYYSNCTEEEKKAYDAKVGYANEDVVCYWVQSSNGNAIVWRKGKNVTKYCKISCTTFARKLFDDWGLDDTYRYRTIGRMVQSDKKVMVLFDFSQAEKWKGDKAVK